MNPAPKLSTVFYRYIIQNIFIFLPLVIVIKCNQVALIYCLKYCEIVVTVFAVEC